MTPTQGARAEETPEVGTRPTVALAHDYLTQRGGAERVAMIMVQAFPDAPLHTTLYHLPGTFPQFEPVDIRTGWLNHSKVLRRNHRLALPLLAPAVSSHTIDADVVLASSSGWAHGFRTDGQMVVYCHAPARWLYQAQRYLGAHTSTAHSTTALVERAVLAALAPGLRCWDRRAAARADLYLANSSVSARLVYEVYGIAAEFLPPPPAVLPDGPEEPVEGLTPGFGLCVARLLPYKNVDLVIEAAAQLDGFELVIVGDGPDRERIAAMAAETGARLLSGIPDTQLRWLYRSASVLVAASFEDFGLSPLEANAFATPVVALRAGGYLDTVVEGSTGLFFDELTPTDIAAAVDLASRQRWDPQALTGRADEFGMDRFAQRLHEVVGAVVRP
ncbi:MAG: glycosyltransferase [Micrococcales bacterium]|nr:glycosyltransferase [Micrococcales bacterium]MCL2666487.1 glycosyltransferase [Micrococcales bacterium]